MRALQLIQPRTFRTVEAQIPHLSSRLPERVIIKTAWVSMCGSDIPFYTGNKRFKSYPLPIGNPIHECTGEVVESSSEEFKVGEHVLAIPEGDQGLAEYFVAETSKTLHLPVELADYDTCCIIQPLSTVMNALDRLGDIRGQSIVVTGLGSIGLLFCWQLEQRGVAQIIGIDPLEERCRLAVQYGADLTFPMRSIEVLHCMRQDHPLFQAPDICIEAVGHQMDTLNDCIELVRKQGTVLAFGVPDHPVYALEYEKFFRKNAHLVAVVTPVWKEYLSKACQEFIEHRAELETFFTHRFPFREAGKAFAMYERHEDGIIKALINASEW